MNTKLALALALALAAVPSMNAATLLYSDDFSGSVDDNLNGTTPATTIGTNSWIAHENWKADGSIAGGNSVQANDQSAFLAFTPTAGSVYTLTATLEQPSGGGGGGMWAAIGFTNDTLGTATGNNGESFFAGTNAAGPWMLYRTPDDQIAAFGGSGTANGSGNLVGFTGTQTMTIVLDTIGASWQAEWFVGGSSIFTHIYATNPTISYVGLGRENNASVDFSSFSLTVIPEPSAVLISALGLLAMVRRRRN